MAATLLYRGPDLDLLHEDFAKHGTIDPHAPVQAHVTVPIAAPMPVVWSVLADLEGWTLIDPDIRAVTAPATITTDVSFQWRVGPTRIRSRFAVVDPPHELTWTGHASGVRAVHRNLLEPFGAGTRFTTEESLAGPFVTWLFGADKLETQLRSWAGGIKRLSETRRACR